MGLVFTFKSERDAFVRRIKSEGLFSMINDGIEDEETKELLFVVFDNAFGRLNEDDYDRLVNNICDSISYDTNDVWEVYLDVSEDEYTNTNYSTFIVSKDEPTIEQATKLLRKHNKLEDGYHIRSIQESNWDAEDIEEEDLMYL